MLVNLKPSALPHLCFQVQEIKTDVGRVRRLGVKYKLPHVNEVLNFTFLSEPLIPAAGQE